MLATGVIVYSPMQMMFCMISRLIGMVKQEVEFWRKLPVVWDESIGISGEIGEYAIIARRKGSEWFIGCINNEEIKPANEICYVFWRKEYNLLHRFMKMYRN